MPNPVFVVGVFRSGTSLLYSLLNRHPQVSLMYECDVWDFPAVLSRVRFRRDWLTRQEFYNWTLSRHGLNFVAAPAGAAQTRTPDCLYRAFGERQGASRWGEKSPHYCTRLRELARWYPDGAFILLSRDPVEVRRSIVRAGRRVRFFRRRGNLSRQIFLQEQLTRQASAIRLSGARVYQVTYSDLIDRTAEVCRGLCQFLDIDFDPAMLELGKADFSALYPGPGHEQLRRAVIERQQVVEVLDPATIEKLQRFHARWERLSAGRSAAQSRPEPSASEQLFHHVLGAALLAFDGAKRALFEFLPLSWLRTYRRMRRRPSA